MPDNVTPHSPTERRSADRPRGLPILSTAVLTKAERQKLLDLQRRYRGAVALLEDCLECGRVDRALDGLQFLTRDVDGEPAAIALTLGSNR